MNLFISDAYHTLHDTWSSISPSFLDIDNPLPAYVITLVPVVGQIWSLSRLSFIEKSTLSFAAKNEKRLVLTDAMLIGSFLQMVGFMLHTAYRIITLQPLFPTLQLMALCFFSVTWLGHVHGIQIQHRKEHELYYEKRRGG